MRNTKLTLNQEINAYAKKIERWTKEYNDLVSVFGENDEMSIIQARSIERVKNKYEALLKEIA